jgi:hypothetical protein
MIHIVEEIKLLLLLGNRLKYIRGNVRYLVSLLLGTPLNSWCEDVIICRSADEWVMYRQRE